MAEKEIKLKLKLNEVIKSKKGFRRYEYNPNVIHNKGMCEVEVVDDSTPQYTEPSVTDREAYRVTLASMRGLLDSNGMFGSSNVGQYSLPDGVYHPELDFSYLRRKDLTIVDIDNYIADMKLNLEKYDGDLKLEIEKTLAEAEKVKETVKKEAESKESDSD